MNPLILNEGTASLSSPVIVALDFPDAANTLEFVSKMTAGTCRLKVGKELFTASGAKLVETLVARGFDVFLDLKYHDIPNTVASACKVAAELGVWMVDVHASGGQKMIEAARDVLSAYSKPPLLIAVTVLTSLTDADMALFGANTVNEMVERLALLAKQSGADGVVCSALEAQRLRALCGDTFQLVTPGIRPASYEKNSDDQRRIMTPIQAMQAGSNYLVIGRPITRAADPNAALAAIHHELNGGTR